MWLAPSILLIAYSDRREKGTEKMEPQKSAFELKLEAMDLLHGAMRKLFDADGMLGHTSDGAAFLSAQEARVREIYDDLRDTCTRCGKQHQWARCND